MSKASKIINIFIFVFAIVVVVFGVLLFQKREQITQARSDIAATVEKVSRLIDSSAVIPADDLKISKTPAEVKEAMVKLESAVDKIVKQRNAIAENLTDVTNTVLEKAFYDVGDEPFILESGEVTKYRGYDETLTDIKTIRVLGNNPVIAKNNSEWEKNHPELVQKQKNKIQKGKKK